MKKEILSILFCASFLFVAILLTSSCDSGYQDRYDEGFSAGYDSGYEDCLEENGKHDDAYQDGYNEGIAELETYKEENLIVPYLIEELISAKKYNLVKEILDSDIYYNDAILGKYVGDREKKFLHSGNCEALRDMPVKRYVIFNDNYSAALENGYKKHSCIETDVFTDEEIKEIWGHN